MFCKVAKELALAALEKSQKEQAPPRPAPPALALLPAKLGSPPTVASNIKYEV